MSNLHAAYILLLFVCDTPQRLIPLLFCIEVLGQKENKNLLSGNLNHDLLNLPSY